MEQEGSELLPLSGDALTEVNPSSPRNQILVKMGKTIVQGGHEQRDIFHCQPTENQERKNQRITSCNLQVAMMIF